MKNHIVFLSLAMIVTLVSCAHASEAAPAASAAAEPAAEAAAGPGAQAAESSEPAYLFVQNAQGIESADGKLTLKGVSPTTVYFTDRPQRSAGQGRTEDFIKMWDEGKDSFQSDPPNATLSIFEAEDDVTNVVLALSNPSLNGQDLTYDVQTLEGALPPAGGPVALFIDLLIIRRPPLVVAPAMVVRPAPLFLYRPHPVIVY